MTKFIINIFLVFVFACSFVFAQSDLTVKGLKQPVEVKRDERSIPYISAKTDDDLYFAQGYVTASDRLWQMDLLRRVARGETAEIFGKLTLEEDKKWRRYGFALSAEKSLEHLDPAIRASIKNFADGVNAYIDSLDEKTMPVEFRILQYKPRHWTPADTIMVGKIITEALSSTYSRDLLREAGLVLSKEKQAELLDPVTPFDVIMYGSDKKAKKAVSSAKPRQISQEESNEIAKIAEQHDTIRKSSLERIGFFAEELAASNNWVVSGKRTADGKPILANDPHLMPNAPGVWYMVHLTSPNVRTAGVTFPGVPGVVLGHNEHIAWGATNVGPDVQDLYIETFNDKGEYKTPEGWKQPEVRKETIKIRKSVMSPETADEMLEVTTTRHGPIIVDRENKKYALNWTAFDPKNAEMAVFYLANRAKNWEEFKSALKTYGGATQNFVYADTKGNIGWYAAGRIPIRRTGDGALPYDGATNEGDWTGYIPFDELPHLYNPESGLIMTANQRITGMDYKYTQIMRDAAPPWRARRLMDLLSADNKLTVEKVSAMQYDAFSIPHSRLAKYIVDNKAASEETLKRLAEWDGVMSADSNAPFLVNGIRSCASQKIADENKPAPTILIMERILDKAIISNAKGWLPKEFTTYQELLKGCDEQWAKDLGEMYYSMNWGKTIRANFPHPLAKAPLIGAQFATPQDPLNGSSVTPNVASYVSMRLIATPGNWDATSHLIPLGQSGNVRSEHFKDQFETWKTGKTWAFPFSEKAVTEAARTTQVLKPQD